MEIKRTLSKIIYRIEPKPEGGFIARPGDPEMPPIEAATREELQQKVRAAMSSTLASEFPGLKLPLENTELKLAFHIEPKPGGGFIAHANDPSQPPIEGATHEEVQHRLADKLVGMLGGQALSELSEVLGKPIDSGDVQVFVNRKVFVNKNVGFTAQLGSHKLAWGDSKTLPSADTPQAEDIRNETGADLASNSPIVPEAAGNWKLFRFLLGLALLILLYFFFHRK